MKRIYHLFSKYSVNNLGYRIIVDRGFKLLGTIQGFDDIKADGCFNTVYRLTVTG